MKRYKARFVAKGFSQKEGIDYKEMFSPISTKDSLRIIMEIVAYYNLRLHHMDIKNAFLNGYLYENVHMVQPIGFLEMGNENLVCNLKKSIYGLKQPSRQWYLKFNEVVTKNDFEKNVVDKCIYMKVRESSFLFLVLYVNGILLATNDTNLTGRTL